MDRDARRARILVLTGVLLMACTGRIDARGSNRGDGFTLPGERDPNGHASAGASGGAGDGDGDGDSIGDGDGDGDTTPGLVCDGLGDVGAPVPMRRLNATQVERTVADVLHSAHTLEVTDEKLFTYRSNTATSIDAASARAYLDFAEDAVADADLSQCTGDCLAWLLDDVGPRLFRRPLDDAQRARYTQLYELGAGPQWPLQAMLQSPSFLYVDETQDADGYLDGYSIAARLAFVIWGSNPDEELLAKAKAGELATAAQVRDEAERMLDDPRSLGGLRDFVDQWLELARLDDPDTRPDLAELGAETIAALRDEPVQLFRAQLEGGGSIEQLLTATETAENALLMSTYDADIMESSDGTYALDPARRAGILSLPGVMAALSHARRTSPTVRGFAVLSNFLCTPPPPPPAGVNVNLPEVADDATSRERLEAHFSDDTCGMCHRDMDGIGFAFEGIDWLGRSRDTEFGKPIDNRSTFNLDGQSVTVEGVVELASAMAHNESVALCVATQWARYATGVRENGDARCLMQELGAQIRESDGLRNMMLTYLTSDWFRRARVLEDSP